MPLPPLADAESIVFGATAPNARIENGDLMITIDPDDDANTDNSVLFTTPISSLVQGGQKTVNGMTHMSELQEYVAAQRRVLAGWIALDAAADGNERETNTGRNDIWQAIRARVLQSVFGLDDLTALPTSGTASDTVGFMAETYPGTRNADDSASLDTAADDVEALVFLDRLVAAVGSAAGWEAARLEGGIFFDDDNQRSYHACDNEGCANVNRGLEAGSAVFNRRQERLFVGFDTTDYTRFGFWRREYTTYAARGGYETDNRTDGDAASRNNGFAFSPLAAATYASPRDPAHPEGTARYAGKTVANQHTTRWVGNVGVTVRWHAETITSSDVTVVVSDLVDPDGLPASYTGGNISELIFTGTDNVAADATTNELTFSSSTARVAYRNRSTPDRTVGELVDLRGMFVGKGLDGPRALIGTWSIAGGGINGDPRPMVGGFGADLAGSP